MSKKYNLLLLILLISLKCFSQIISPNGNNIFYYNGAADVNFRFADRGSGGRAFVHAPGNVLALNFGNDFDGGTTIGNQVYFKDGGNSYIYSGNLGIGTATPEGTLELKKLNAGLVFDLNTNGLTKIVSKGWNSSVDFSTFKISGIQNQNQLHLNTDGNVGIGTSIPKEKLSVNGKIRAHEIKVETSNWPDYVFEEDYRLRSLAELRDFIEQRKHLPEVPTAKEAEYEGIALGEMNKLLLKKVEELTLYLLEKDKELSEVKKQMLETT